MAHVMVDLETWGTHAGAAIRSIGACMFDPVKGTIEQTFYMNITDASCLAAGLVKEPGTVEWWAKPKQALAQKALEPDQRSLMTALLAFSDWWKFVGGYQFWCQGANFDPPILEACYDALCLEVPWKFFAVRCCRTALEMGNRKAEKLKDDTAHNAADDAASQARALMAAFRTGTFAPR